MGSDTDSDKDMARTLRTYPAFWSYYLREHRKPATRGLHYLGSALALGFFAIGVSVEPGLLFFIPIAGYGFAWLGHLLVEKNKPATFSYPLWSLYSDFRMFGLWITGRLKPHLKRAGVLDQA